MFSHFDTFAIVSLAHIYIPMIHSFAIQHLLKLRSRAVNYILCLTKKWQSLDSFYPINIQFEIKFLLLLKKMTNITYFLLMWNLWHEIKAIYGVEGDQ